jgi:hypothetical protein
LASRSNNLYRKARFLRGRKNIDSARFYRWPSPLSVSALPFFHRTPPAEIARAIAKAKSLPGTTQENIPLKVGDYCLYCRPRSKVHQYRSMVTIQGDTHLFRRRRKRRANQTLAISVAAELTLQSDPGSGYHV